MIIEINIASFYLIGYSNFTFQSIILEYQCTSFGGTFQLKTDVIHRLLRREFFRFQQERKVYIFDEFSFLLFFIKKCSTNSFVKKIKSICDFLWIYLWFVYFKTQWFDEEAKSYLLNILVHYCKEVDAFMLSVTMGRKPSVSTKIYWEFRMLKHSCIINGEIYRLISDEFIVQRDLILWSLETTFIFQRLKDLWKRRALSLLSVSKGAACTPTPQFMISVQESHFWMFEGSVWPSVFSLQKMEGWMHEASRLLFYVSSQFTLIPWTSNWYSGCCE